MEELSIVAGTMAAETLTNKTISATHNVMDLPVLFAIRCPDGFYAVSTYKNYLEYRRQRKMSMDGTFFGVSKCWTKSWV